MFDSVTSFVATHLHSEAEPAERVLGLVCVVDGSRHV